jgi:putative transposase
MDQQHLKRLIELEEENNRLKQMYADVRLDVKMQKDVLIKKF